MKNITISICLILSINAFGQSVTTDYGQAKITDLMIMSNQPDNPESMNYTDIEGSPYNDSEFIKGDVKFILGKSVNGVPLRINLLQNVLEFKSEDKLYILTDFSKISSVVLGQEVYKPVFIYDGKEGKQVLMLQIAENEKSQLFEHTNITFIEAKPAKSSYSSPIKAQFKELKPTYYLKTENHDAIEVSRKNFDSLSGPNQIYSDYVKENKIKVKGVEEMLKVINSI